MQTARLMSLVPLLGAVVAIATVAILSSPGAANDEPSVVAFVLILLVLLLVPHAALAVILLRSAPSSWLWRLAGVISVIATACQLLVCGILFADDDPQTPILLALYAPAQLIGVGLLLVVALVISRIVGRASVSDDLNGDEQSGR